MKNKVLKKVLGIALISSMVLGMAACGETTDPVSSVDPENPSSSGEDVVLPDVTSISVMMDSTVFTQPNGRDEFEKALEEVMGVDIEFIQPDHSGYYDVVSQTFAGDKSTWPDVVLLGSSYYASYANNGVLADISEYYETASFKDRVKSQLLIDGLRIGDGLYGISPSRGNGCVTYIKQTWLDECGLEAPTNYEEYCAMLDAFVEKYGTYAVTSSGIMNAEAPYVNYLPEFFQDAYPDFMEVDGQWIDGFAQPEMEAALERLVEAYDEGWLDPECITNKTSDCRDKFYADKCGVFTYWAGTWADTLASKLEAAGLSGELVALEPIDEVGAYIERQAVVWGITTACENPAQVFEKFFGTMLDGDQGQILWTYGVEDVHWSTKGETISYGEGDKAKSIEYAEGTFHFCVNLETKDSQYKKNHIDPMLSIVSFKGEDVGLKAVAQRALDCATMFNENFEMAPVITSNETMVKYLSGINELRIQLITEVVTGGLSYEDAIARYNDEQGANVQEILDSLN